VELAHGVIALETAEGQHDSAAYQALAAKAAELFGSAVLVVCALPHARQSAHVYRRGEKLHVFRLPSTGPREAVAPLSEESDESWVALPLVEGLDLAGLKGPELARLLCKQLGKHEHSTQGARDA